jgi:hypothetical protein
METSESEDSGGDPYKESGFEPGFGFVPVKFIRPEVCLA